MIIHAVASKTQLGEVISQNGKPIPFYSHKLTPAQTNYTTTEIDLLSTVETLKEFCTIILGRQITVYTDRNNITFENFTTETVLHWRILSKEYGPEIKYIKGRDNNTTDNFSILPSIKSDVTERNITRGHLAESYGINKLDRDTFPLTYLMIDNINVKTKIWQKN